MSYNHIFLIFVPDENIPIFTFTVDGIETWFNDEHLENANELIDFNEAGKLICENDMQFSKADISIKLREEWSITLTKDSHPQKVNDSWICF